MICVHIWMISLKKDIICANLLLLEVGHPSSVSRSEVPVIAKAEISLSWGSSLVEGDLSANQRHQCYKLHMDLMTKDETNLASCQAISIRIIREKRDRIVAPPSDCGIGRAQAGEMAGGQTKSPLIRSQREVVSDERFLRLAVDASRTGQEDKIAYKFERNSAI
jgi:hypothetical protein